MQSKSIARIHYVKLSHYMVSGNLSYDRSAGNRQTQFIAPGYSSLRDGTLRQSYSVDNEEVWLSGQFFHRLHHSQPGGSKDINGVNHLRRNDADAHSHSLFANQTGQRFPLFGVQLLAISDQLKPGQIG
jgi:hypothetical protein